MVYRVAKSWKQLKQPCVHRCKTFFFAFGSSATVRVEREAGAAAWLVGTLAVPSVQGHRFPLLQEVWPYQSFLEPLVAGDQASGRSFSIAPPAMLCLDGSFAWGPSLLFGVSGTYRGPPGWHPTP